MPVYEFILNGKPARAEVESNTTLLKTLREYFGLTGAKEGCGKGECGACTVIVNGRAVNSCLILTSQISGAEVLTIEGLGSGEEPDPLQDAFVEAGAVQCGYCTPGMVLSARALLMKIPNPTTQEIKESIAGNICRCTGYVKIIEAIEKVAEAQENKA